MTAFVKQPSLRRERAAGLSFLRRSGRGQWPPTLFLHGIGSNASSWTSLVERLDPQFEAILWDAPGYGESSPLAGSSPSPSDYAQAIETLLDALEISQAAIVGHSLGSLFAGYFAALRPHRVAALALLSPALGYGVPAGAPLPPQVQARIDDLQRLGAAAFAARGAPRLLVRPETKPELVERIETAMAAVDPGGYAQAVRALGAGDLLSCAVAIQSPALVAVGADDVVTPPENARRLHQALVQPGPFHLISNSGHALPQEAPGEAAMLLSAFIRESANV
jgi:pimeloyl-ACP methyl ester carboxylesterase